MISAQTNDDIRITEENFDEIMRFCGKRVYEGSILSEGYPAVEVENYLQTLTYKDWKQIIYILAYAFIFSGYGTGWVGTPSRYKDKIEVTLVTGGWSGNEEMLSLTQEIDFFKGFYYTRWESGGLHSFEFPKDKETDDNRKDSK